MRPQYLPTTHVPAVACGVFSLTYTAEFPLHSLRRLHRLTFAQLLYQPGEFQQIHHAKECTLRADNDLRIRSNEICPLRRNRADDPLIDLQQEPSARPVVPLAHARELLAAEGMEWVRDAHKTRRCDRSACTLD
jgi:hypothetical protein